MKIMMKCLNSGFLEFAYQVKYKFYIIMIFMKILCNFVMYLLFKESLSWDLLETFCLLLFYHGKNKRIIMSSGGWYYEVKIRNIRGSPRVLS